MGRSASTSKLRHSTFVTASLALFLLGLCAAPAWAAPSWLSPVNVSVAGRDAFDAQVAMNDAGDAVAVWERSDGTDFRVQAAIRPAGGSFSAPVNLSAAGEDAAEPQVAMNDAGDVVVVWRRFDGSNQIVQAAIRPAGGGFSAPDDLSAAGANAIAPQVAMNEAGEAVAVWQRGMIATIQAASRPSGGSFSGAADISVAGQSAFAPQVAIDGAGEAIAVWDRFDGTDQRVQASIRPPGGGFASPDNLSASGQDALMAQVAMDPAGDAVAVWERSDGTNARVQGATRPAGGSFAGAVNLSAAGQDASRGQVAIDEAGDAVAIWERSNGTNTIVQTASRLAGSGFSPPVNVSTPGRDADFPQVAMNDAGDAIAVFRRFNGTNFRVQASNRPAGGSFSARVNLSTAGRDAELPQVAMDDAGDGIAVWRRTNGTNLIVQAAGYDADGPQLRNLSVPGSGTTGSPVSFSVAPFDVWSAVSTTFAFGDGASASGNTASHTYCSAGTHQVKVTATDAVGNSTSATRAISIAASNEFSLGKVKKNKKKGTAKLTVEVPGAGALELAKTKKVKSATADASCNGKVKLRVKAKGKAKKKLNKKGKAKVKAKVRFTPTGGSAAKQSKKIKLKRKP